MTIYFYSTRDAYGSFSNFSAHGFVLKGVWWPTSEHYFQAQKFAGSEHEELVRRAKTPKQAAELGRDRRRPLRTDWEQVKDDMMREAVGQSFALTPTYKLNCSQLVMKSWWKRPLGITTGAVVPTAVAKTCWG